MRLNLQTMPQQHSQRPTLSVIRQSAYTPVSAQSIGFEGQSKTAQKSWLGRTLLGMTALVSGVFPTLAVAQQPAEMPLQPIVQTPQANSAGTLGINESATPFVDRADQLPQLNRNLHQRVVDLVQHPLLKPETKAELTQLLHQEQMLILVLPDTHAKELNSLATDLGSQMGIGKAGQNNGLIYLINAAAVREHREHGKMFILPGANLKSKFANGEAAKIIRDHALPHLQRGDVDAAVREVTGILKTKINSMQIARAQQGQWREEDIIAAFVIAALVIVVLAILALIILNGGLPSSGSGGGYSPSGGGYSSNDSYSPSSTISWSSSSDSSNDSGSSVSDFGGGTFDGGGGGGD